MRPWGGIDRQEQGMGCGAAARVWVAEQRPPADHESIQCF